MFGYSICHQNFVLLSILGQENCENDDVETYAAIQQPIKRLIP